MAETRETVPTAYRRALDDGRCNLSCRGRSARGSALPGVFHGPPGRFGARRLPVRLAAR